MEQVIAELRRRYEFILVDTPALLDFIDVTALSGQLDGLILLADGHRVRRAQLRNAQRVVDLAGIKTLGVVMNQVGDDRFGAGFLRSPRSRPESQRSTSPAKSAQAAPAGGLSRPVQESGVPSRG
jgi:CO dehydrogenase nickel-insertion accessory protein CooC1